MTGAASPPRHGSGFARLHADPRDIVAGIDPGLARLRLALVAVVAMMAAAGGTELVRLSLFPTAPVTVLLVAGAVTMISNLAVNEPDLHRRRVTTALALAPALVTIAAGTLLAPYRVVADVVFVAVMVAAVWVRRYGPRGFALGQIAFITFFFSQFLRLQAAQLPEVLIAVTIAIASTFLLRCVLFAERPERTLRRLVGAFRARAHALLTAVDEVLAHLGPSPDAGAAARGLERDLDRMARARRRLNETAILVEDQLEQATAGRVWPGLENDLLALRVFDAELALERLTVATRRLAGPDSDLGDPAPLLALRIGLARLRSALALGTRHAGVLEGTADARGAVAGLCADTAAGHERIQRTAFAVRRVADSVEHAQRDAPARAAGEGDRGRPQGDDRVTATATDTGGAGRAGLEHDDALRPPPRPAPDPRTGGAPPTESTDSTDSTDSDRGAAEGTGAPTSGGLALTSRQAIQVGVATTLAIVGGELLAPSRWYWAVIAAFVVFANTSSRGDLLSRGWGRIVGTIGGVAAGMGLAALVVGHTLTSLVLLFACVFLALYLVRISPGLLAFWITAVLALVYGLIGQFSVQVLVLRIEETVVGVLASVVAAFVVLPKGTRDAFADSLGSFVDAADAVLEAAVDRLVGRTPARSPVVLAREMDDALADLRLRVRPLSPAFGVRRRGRSSYQRGLRVMVGVDHYARSLARLSDTAAAGEDRAAWAPTLDPAARAVRANLDALRDVLSQGRRRSDGGRVLVTSAEEAVDAAEGFAAQSREPHRRADMLTVARMLRRTDQAVVSLASDLGAAPDVDDGSGAAQEPRSASSAGLANTRAGS